MIDKSIAKLGCKNAYKKYSVNVCAVNCHKEHVKLAYHSYNKNFIKKGNILQFDLSFSLRPEYEKFYFCKTLKYLIFPLPLFFLLYVHT